MSNESINIPLSSDTHYLDIKPNSNKLLIVFSATGTKPGKFNLWKLRELIPHNILYLRVPTNDWYQVGIPGLASNHEDTILAIKNLISYYKFEHIFTMGSSMGAYGALLYGCFLECNALAFNPETKMKLSHSRSHKMMPLNSEVHFDDLKPLLENSSAKYYIFTGEQDPVDLYSAQRVSKLKNIKIVTFPDEEHTVLRNLVATNRILPVLWSFTNYSEPPKLEDTGRILENTGFAEKFYHGFSASRDKDHDKAKKLLMEALDIYPASAYCHHILTRTLYSLKQYELGKNHALFALALEPENPRYLANLAYYFRRIGLIREAIKIHLNIQSKWPDAYYSKYELAMIYINEKKKTQARRLLEDVVALQPKNKSYQRALAQVK